MTTIITYILLFFVYAFVGWLLEVINIFITKQKFVNRGFLLGSICPVYGFGGVLMILFLHKYLEDPLVLFIMAMVLCGVLEYFTSYILEKLFNTRWWDYSTYKFNINGRVYLGNLVLFGIAGVFLMYLLHPLVLNIINSMPEVLLYCITVFFLTVFILDVIVSVKIGFKFKSLANKVIKKDSTQEVNKFAKNILKNQSYLYRRIVKAFPDFKTGFRFKK